MRKKGCHLNSIRDTNGPDDYLRYLFLSTSRRSNRWYRLINNVCAYFIAVFLSWIFRAIKFDILFLIFLGFSMRELKLYFHSFRLSVPLSQRLKQRICDLIVMIRVWKIQILSNRTGSANKSSHGIEIKWQFRIMQ